MGITAAPASPPGLHKGTMGLVCVGDALVQGDTVDLSGCSLENRVLLPWEAETRALARLGRRTRGGQNMPLLTIWQVYLFPWAAGYSSLCIRFLFCKMGLMCFLRWLQR